MLVQKRQRRRRRIHHHHQHQHPHHRPSHRRSHRSRPILLLLLLERHRHPRINGYHRRRILQQKKNQHQHYHHHQQPRHRQSDIIINNNNHYNNNNNTHGRFTTTVTTTTTNTTTTLIQRNKEQFVDRQPKDDKENNNNNCNNNSKIDNEIDITITKLEKGKNAYEQSALKDYFLKLINSLPTENTFYVYCDGSKKENKVGCGVFIKDYYGENCGKSIHKRIEDNTSIEEAELHGIHEALKAVVDKERNVYVFVDSQPALSYLQSVEKGKKKMYVPIVEKCKKLIVKIQAKGFFVKFFWIPSHVELPNHEYADHLAEQGRERSVVDIGIERGVVESFASNVINLRVCSVFLNKK